MIEETNTDWWKGRVDGREGLFPSTYVEKLLSQSQAQSNIRAPSTSSSSITSSGSDSDPVTSTKPAINTFVGGVKLTAATPSGLQNKWGASTPLTGGGERGERENAPESTQPQHTLTQKKSKFGRFGRQAGDAAAGGVGYGAG